MKDIEQIQINLQEADDERIRHAWWDIPKEDERKIKLTKARFAHFVQMGLFPATTDFMMDMILLVAQQPDLLDMSTKAIAKILGLPDLGEEVPRDKRIPWEQEAKQLGAQITDISTFGIHIVAIVDDLMRWVAHVD